MSRRHLCAGPAARLFAPFAACVVACLAACSDMDPPRAARVELRAPDERIDAAEDIRRSRAELAAVAAVAQDAWTVPLGAERAVRISAGMPRTWRIEAGVDLSQAPKADPALRVRLEAKVWQGQASIAHSATIADLSRGWTSLPQELVLPKGDLRLVLSAKVEGEAPPDAALVRAAFAIPLGWRDRKEAAADAPNVLVLSIDTLRADRLGCYGYDRGTTPNLDKLAAQGVLFERAYSSAPWTLPSYASLFTALLPADHRAGVVTEREDRFGTDEKAPKKTTELLRPDAPTIAERAREAGYATAGFYCNPYIGAGAGVDRGFDRWTRYQHGAKAGTRMAQGWIAEHAQKPWFVFLHLIDPHMPYAPPAPYDERFAGVKVEDLAGWPPALPVLRGGADDALKRLCSDLYDGEVAYADAQLGLLLDSLRASGELDNTLVVLHSDHGEEFWEHGGCDHGHALHEELLRVPFAVVWPGRIAPRRVDERVRTLDLFPTLSELFGWQGAHPAAEGRSLVPFLRPDGRKEERSDRDVVAEAILWGDLEQKARLAGSLKYVAAGSGGSVWEIAGGGTLLPLHPDQGAELRAWLLERHRRTQAADRPKGVLQLDQGSKNELARIGYAGD